MPLKLLFLTIAKNQASYKYRVDQFLPFWNEHNSEADSISLVGLSSLSKLKIAFSTSKYDVVILQKKTLHPLLIRIIKKRSILVFDFDDALYAKPFFHSGKIKTKHPGSSHTIKRLNFILAQADLVVAGSKALFDYSLKLNPKCTIIPTAYSAPGENPDPGTGSQPGPVQIGWIGGTNNLVYLSLIESVLLKLQAEGVSFELVIISGKQPAGFSPAYRFIHWNPEAEDFFLRSIDVGIMPLSDDDWSRGKCAFKLLQYMAFSKPVIASAVGENNTAVIQGKTGFLARTSDEWENAFRRLIEDSELRRTMGREGFGHFHSNYSRPVVQAKLAGELSSLHKNSKRN